MQRFKITYEINGEEKNIIIHAPTMLDALNRLKWRNLRIIEISVFGLKKRRVDK